MMKKHFMVSVLALIGAVNAHAQVDAGEFLPLTTSTVVNVPGSPNGAPQNGFYDNFGYCGTKGLCAQTISFPTTSGGTLTVSATDGPWIDNEALVFQSNQHNAGLGVVTGYYKKNGVFKVFDSSYSLSSKKERLTFTFEKEISLDRVVMFPNDRLTYSVLNELDTFDAFTVSVDGGPFVEYPFTQSNQVTFCKPESKAKRAPLICNPLVGKTFTFGYAAKKSVENYYIGGLVIRSMELPPEE
jgi:hypothetical protein